MIKKILYMFALMLQLISLQATVPVFAAPALGVAATQAAPVRNDQLFFKDINAKQINFNLTNFNPGEYMEFNVRKDELVSHALFHLIFTPSPALVPLLSQLKVYLNDELVQVIVINAEQLGKLNSVQIPINPIYVKDFNRLRLELIGHYESACENPTNSAIWIEIDKQSTLDLTFQKLELKNDLATFPEPFFDELDYKPLNLNIIFSEQPNLQQQRAAAILASWFGSKASWRGVSFRALFNQLPTNHAVVFATNAKHPDFLKDYKAVDAPTVEMISHPDNPYVKLLLISGRNDDDLMTAVQGISQGNVLFRGAKVVIDNVKLLKPRQPYDAPNWVRTDEPVAFSQLADYDGQLQTKGAIPKPVLLRFNTPPDLFLNQNRGIGLRLKYRYSLPPEASLSEMDISFNQSFIKSYKLDLPKESTFANNMAESSQKLYIYAPSMGSHNQLGFQFQYGTQIAGGLQNGQCTTYKIIDNFGEIDNSSTIDFSNYYHYIDMPNLNAFVKAGFPFSRMADLSETVVLVTSQAKPEQVTTLLNVIGLIGAETGFPAFAMTLTNNWSEVKSRDADLLIIGSLPEDLRNTDDLNVLLNKTKDWVKMPFKSSAKTVSSMPTINERVESKATVNATGTSAAILGMQSPYNKQRSVIALLAENQQDFDSLNNTLTNKNHFDKIFGSVTVIRSSGVTSMHVGNSYHLGDLPWWNTFWFALENHPIKVALLSILAVVIMTFLLWNGLVRIREQRLKGRG